MKSLVTGASGFVGSAVIRHLLKNDHEVKVLVRKNSDRKNLIGLEIEIIEGDLRDTGSLKRALADCKNLFHVAADYRLWIPDPHTMYEINVKGTANLMLAAAEASVEKIVYTSSVATLGFNEDSTPADEMTPSGLKDMIGHYKRSKYLAEAEVQNLVKKHHLPVTIVNPSTPIGPRDIKPTPTGKVILDSMHGRMPAYVDTGLNVVHVDDVAIGHLLALQSGKIGERYILGGENLSLKSILEAVASLTNRKAPGVRLPHNLVLPAAWLMEKWAYRTGKAPMATVDSIKMSKKRMYFSSNKAIRELKYQPRPAIEAIRDAVDWFKEHDY